MANKIYLDYAATTPVAPEVLQAMLPFFSEKFGNASSVHGFGREGKHALDRARVQIAAAFGVEAHEVIFTSGGTEANNLAIRGVAQKYAQPQHIITTAVEHPSVLAPCRHLEKCGWRVTYLPVDEWGRVEPSQLKKSLRKDTALISVMTANNETGTLHPITELAAISEEAGISFHTDAVQAVGVLPLDLRTFPVSLLTLSSHKLYGPKGAGALLVRRGVRLEPLHRGGGQEQKLRGGTENVPAIVGFAHALVLSGEQREADLQHFEALASFFTAELQAKIPQAQQNGHPVERAPHILNYSFPGCENTALLMALDLHGIAVSNGSACSSGAIEPSHVLQAMRFSPRRQNSALRFSFGRQTTTEDLRRTIEVLAQCVHAGGAADGKKSRQTATPVIERQEAKS